MIIPTVLERKGRDFQELGYLPFSAFCGWLELSRPLWGCHLADVLPCVYNEAQGPQVVRSSTIFHLVGSNQFMSHPQGLFHPVF